MSGAYPEITCLVVDDEELARQLLATYIARIPGLQLVASCKNPLEAAPYLRQEIDLLFLDIQMPEMSGIEWIKTMPRKPQIILTTAYAEYALEGYQLEVTDYLLKPFPFERFFQAVQKAAEWKRLTSSPHGSLPPQDLPSQGEAPDYLMAKTGHKLVKIRFEELLLIQSKGEYVQYRSTTGNTMSLQSLKQLESILPKSQFMRVHKSFIVHLQKIDAVEGNTLLIGNISVPIGATYKEAVLKKLEEG